MAYELSRHEHVQNKEHVARALCELRDELLRVEAKLGGKRVDEVAPGVLKPALEHVEGRLEDAGPVVGDQIRALMNSVERIAEELDASHERPSRPLLGVLPLARIVPHGAHAALDYVAALAAGAGVALAGSAEAKIASAALSAVGLGVSACSDHRLGAAKLIPVEAHEAIDYAWGAAVIAAPFALGYSKKDPAVAALHVIAGASTILTSLFTNYRLRARGRLRAA